MCDIHGFWERLTFLGIRNFRPGVEASDKLHFVL